MLRAWTALHPGSSIARMERELQVGNQKIRFDREATLALYRDEITVGDADGCTCPGCRNFAAQREQAYPEGFLRFLEELGIDPMKEWEAFDYDFDRKGLKTHLYGGWFLFVGELISGSDDETPVSDGDLAYGFTRIFPAATFADKVKLCAVEFSIRVPWILPETPE